MNTIKLNLSGRIFETTKENVLKIPYFNNMIIDCDNNNIDTIFVNRSGSLFKHVLAYVIDDTYPYPLIYFNELDYYGIIYDKNKLYDCDKQFDIINNNIDNLYIKLNDLQQKIKKIRKLSKNNLKQDNSCIWDDCDEQTTYNYCDKHAEDGRH